MPPSERCEDVPAPVSAIVMKLLAKTAEERYQTAAGAGERSAALPRRMGGARAASTNSRSANTTPPTGC